MAIVFLSLGSNIGDRLHFLVAAKKEINIKIGSIICESSIYEAESWGFSTENFFLNQVIKVNTTLSAIEILNEIKNIEILLGRTRKDINSYEDRIIDIDILFYDNLIINLENLKVPHPLIPMRRFVLEPLNEICADYNHPGYNKKISQLLFECTDKSKITKIT